MNHIRDLESKIYDKIFTRNSSTVPTSQMNFEPRPALSSSPSSRRSSGEDHPLIVGEEPQSPLLSHSHHTTHSNRTYSNKHSPELFEMELGISADSAKRSAPVKVQGQKIKHTDDDVNSLMNTIYDQISGSFNSTTPNSSGSENSAASSVLNSLASSLNSFKSGAAMLDTFAQQYLNSNNTASHTSKTRQHSRSNSDQTFFDQPNGQVTTSSHNTVNSSTTVAASLPAVSSSVPSSTFENVRRARSKTVTTTHKKPSKQKYFKAHAVESEEEEEEGEVSRNGAKSNNHHENTNNVSEKKSTSTSTSSSWSDKHEHLSTKSNKKEMLMLFLLRHICSSINPDPQFFVNTCKKLHSEGYISDLHNCDLVFMKEQSKDFMLDFINNWPVTFTQEERNVQVESAGTSPETDFSSIKKSISQDSYLDRMASRETTKEMTSNIPFFNSMFLNFSRVKTDFKSRKMLGKGAFGHVFQMEHKIDGVTYAVKRIKLCFRDFSQFEEEYNRVIREVKALASLIHPNIVAYNNCWFELCSHTDSVLDSPSHHPFNQTDVCSFHPSTNEESVYSEDAAATPSTPTNDMSYVHNRSYLVPYKTPKSFLSGVSDADHSADFIFEFEKDVSDTHALVGNEAKLNYTVETGSNSPSLKPSQPPHIMLQDSMGNDLIAEDALKNLLSYIYNEKNKRFEIYLFIQMQLCENYTLQDWLWSDERVKENQVDLRKILIYFYQITDAVSYVHSKGIIHRDLKPSNIFLSRTERSEIRIGDFGLSKFVKPPIPGRDTTPNTPLYENSRMFSSTSTFEETTSSSDSSNHTSGLGTVTYASPEQLNQNMYDSKSDIFSLGIILYEMLHPFKTKTERAFVLQDLRRGKFASSIVDLYPVEMQIVKKCLSLESANRPSAEEIKQMILKIQYERKFVEMPCSVLSSEDKSTEQIEEEIKMLEMQLQRLTAQLKNKQK